MSIAATSWILNFLLRQQHEKRKKYRYYTKRNARMWFEIKAKVTDPAALLSAFSIAVVYSTQQRIQIWMAGGSFFHEECLPMASVVIVATHVLEFCDIVHTRTISMLTSAPSPAPWQSDPHPECSADTSQLRGVKRLTHPRYRDSPGV